MNEMVGVEQVQLIEASTDTPDRQSFQEAVKEGFSADQKWMDPRFLYDRRGSELFEEITRQPEYYPYRAEREILETNAEEITSSLGSDGALVEFGSGNAEKTRILLRAVLRRTGEGQFVPIDISADFLEEAARDLLNTFDGLRVTPVAGTYRSALEHLPERTDNRLFLFLGGSIGNFEPEEARDLLSAIQRVMAPGDRLLLGFDRLKEPEVIEAAYNDREGVTAAFNKNLLRRINRELGGSFDLDQFRHNAPFVPKKSRIEMRLVSRTDQQVPVEALDRVFSFDAGEIIHTENSYKFEIEDMVKLCEEAGLRRDDLWQDKERRFCAIRLAPSRG